ncbi:hypothetical protein Fleli_0708 [Bernardetia litoralis DSM 6794]|uniref:Uncharacterized protein n=1 Tax=Bernardetia litoralis (strain ATCC 23117 / DSM 6794 / NBRC 15988 / NCIMB 1366 / Fx l1 / Sio-4) TaxID=880071 RepID=I4AGT4_BERLS|nr:hypothetical protein [Bernardetia litoralis]AFM03169.1 hypothetical protein Fleli_0708 [Bernardetia litoralis DSM 6794]
MKNSEKRPFFLSQKTIRTLALLFVALLTAGAILILGGFEINWKGAWEALLKM